MAEEQHPTNVIIHNIQADHYHSPGCGCFVLAVGAAAWITLLVYFIIKWMGY